MLNRTYTIYTIYTLFTTYTQYTQLIHNLQKQTLSKHLQLVNIKFRENKLLCYLNMIIRLIILSVNRGIKFITYFLYLFPKRFTTIPSQLNTYNLQRMSVYLLHFIFVCFLCFVVASQMLMDDCLQYVELDNAASCLHFLQSIKILATKPKYNFNLPV